MGLHTQIIVSVQRAMHTTLIERKSIFVMVSCHGCAELHCDQCPPLIFENVHP